MAWRAGKVSNAAPAEGHAAYSRLRCPIARSCPLFQRVTVEIFTAGDGENYPKPGNTVTLHYIGYVGLPIGLCTVWSQLRLK